MDVDVPRCVNELWQESPLLKTGVDFLGVRQRPGELCFTKSVFTPRVNVAPWRMVGQRVKNKDNPIGTVHLGGPTFLLFEGLSSLFETCGRMSEVVAIRLSCSAQSDRKVVLSKASVMSDRRIGQSPLFSIS